MCVKTTEAWLGSNSSVQGVRTLERTKSVRPTLGRDCFLIGRLLLSGNFCLSSVKKYCNLDLQQWDRLVLMCFLGP